MKLLLDTNTLLWWFAGDEALSTVARNEISVEANDVYVSAASFWEIATKHRLGKLQISGLVASDLEGAVRDESFIGLPITPRHGQAAGTLPGPHRDPFDRMLIAQAMLDDMILVSNKQVFDAYGVRRCW
jgi:PIN domain nuclease of toxin-antitoxin system